MSDEEPTVRSAYIKEFPTVVYEEDELDCPCLSFYSDDTISISYDADEISVPRQRLARFVAHANRLCR